MAFRWLLFAVGAVLLAALAWYFGRPVVPVQHASSESVGVAASTPATEAPKATSPKVMEVIDLARAYDPVREVESPMPGGINPASFVEEQYAPTKIPYATTDEEGPFDDLLRAVKEDPASPFILGAGIITESGAFPRESELRERLDVMPREVFPVPNALLNFVPSAPPENDPQGLNFTPMGVPFQPGPPQPIPPNARIYDGWPSFIPSIATSNEPVRLNFMPRVVLDDTPGNALMHIANRPFSNWGISPRIDISIAVPIEKLEMMPREVK